MGFLTGLGSWRTTEIESPHSIYTQHLQQNRRHLAIHRQWDRFFGFAKLAIGAFTIFAMVRFVHELHGLLLVSVAIAVFVMLAVMHEQVLLRIRNIDALIAFYERGLARLQDRWAGTGEGGEQYIDEAHPYARDLDLFGRGSMFELLCTFRTRAGEETLARWLLEPAPSAEVRARQRASQDLIRRTGFRERLFTAGNKVRLGLHPDLLAAWGAGEPAFASRWLLVLAALLAILWAASFLLAFAAVLAILGVLSVSYGILHDIYLSSLPFLLLSAANLFLNLILMKRLSTSAEAMEAATDDLDLFVEVMRILEQERFESPRLARISHMYVV